VVVAALGHVALLAQHWQVVLVVAAAVSPAPNSWRQRYPPQSLSKFTHQALVLLAAPLMVALAVVVALLVVAQPLARC
jgi:hypothetical protein